MIWKITVLPQGNSHLLSYYAKTMLRTGDAWTLLSKNLIFLNLAAYVSFSIFVATADFQRRERVLEDLAEFKGALLVLFFCHRDWVQASGKSKYIFLMIFFGCSDVCRGGEGCS